MTDSKGITKKTYEDPEVVEAYIQRHQKFPDPIEVLKDFSDHVVGTQVLDLGCGPGMDSYEFAKRGFEVIGLDYSEEMIKRAKELQKVENQPVFVVGDIYQLDQIFYENQFDAVWANKSLLHIPHDEIDGVLLQILKITKPQGMVFVSLKEGLTETKMIKEENYSKNIEREFAFWQPEDFEKVAEEIGFSIHSSEKYTNFKNISWLHFVLQVAK